MKKTFFLLFSLSLLILLTNCSNNHLPEKGSKSYIASIKTWHKKRIENLKKENGWLNLVGLYWLNKGKNKFGTDRDNDIVFPSGKAPAHIGIFTLSDSIVTVKINKGINVLYNGKPVKEMVMKNDLQDSTTVLSYGSLRWFIIKRTPRYGVRLRDLKAPLLKNFKGIKTFPINENWRVTAKFQPYNPPKVIAVPTVIGTIEKDISPGALVFKLKGKKFKLDPVIEGNHLFIVFADKTSGNETYGGGRFLYINKPDSTGKTIIDFNKAYNPPCNFTRFATCPLPPKQNYLAIKITAGEMKYEH